MLVVLLTFEKIPAFPSLILPASWGPVDYNGGGCGGGTPAVMLRVVMVSGAIHRCLLLSLAKTFSLYSFTKGSEQPPPPPPPPGSECLLCSVLGEIEIQK